MITYLSFRKCILLFKPFCKQIIITFLQRYFNYWFYAIYLYWVTITFGFFFRVVLHPWTRFSYWNARRNVQRHSLWCRSFLHACPWGRQSNGSILHAHPKENLSKKLCNSRIWWVTTGWLCVRMISLYHFLRNFFKCYPLEWSNPDNCCKHCLIFNELLLQNILHYIY